MSVEREGRGANNLYFIYLSVLNMSINRLTRVTNSNPSFVQEKLPYYFPINNSCLKKKFNALTSTQTDPSTPNQSVAEV